MKKVMVGILILIPILILFIVAMVSNIISMQAWISVEDIQLTEKWSERTAENISLSLDGIQGKTISIYDYVNVKVLPEKANKYTIEWKIDGNVTYTDEEYQEKYEAYVREISALKSELAAEYPVFSTNERRTAYNQAKIKYPDDSAKIIDEMAKSLVGIMSPAVSFVSEDEFDVDSNSTGKFIVSSYCNFTVKVVAENVSKTLSVSVVGDNVERVTIGNINGEDNNISVGEAKRLVPNYTPIDSIVNYTIWHSDNEDVATVDQNGVVRALKAGSANITMQASVHSSERGEIRYITSGAYVVNVTAKGASTKYGKTLHTAKKSFTLEELGLPLDAVAAEGCTIEENTVTLTADKAVISTENGNFEIYFVEENSIAIANASFFENKENGYVLAVGEHTLKLGAVFSDELALGKPSDVEWTSSDTDVATVNENGEVKGLSNGVVVITASDGNGEYRFVPGDEKANYAYVMENFYEKGINTEIEQTGFMEAYNWQDVSNAALFSTGDASYDEIIKQASGNVLRNNSAFANYRYVDKDNTCWLHVAFVVAGLSFEGSSMYTEVPSMKVTLSDKDSYYTLDTRTIKKESKDFFGLAGETILGSVPIFVYGYPNTAKITPYSTYQINSAFIDRMHG